MKIMLHIIVLKLVGMLLISSWLPPQIVVSAVVHAEGKAAIAQSGETQASSIAAAAKVWQQQLAKQAEFESWQSAALTVHALGPGTHGWIVFIKNNNDVIGYMIVYAKEDGGYMLAEYGNGDAASLNYLANHIASFRYLGPFHSIITLSNNDAAVSYVEPFLQENFPLSKYLISQQQNLQPQQTGQGASKQPALITGFYSLDYFAPYDTMPWLTGQPLNDAFEDDTSVETMIELGSQLRYTTESWNYTIFSAYSVTGFHEWNEFELFLALQGDNEALTRYIAYDTLMEQGYFYDKTNY